MRSIAAALVVVSVAGCASMNDSNPPPPSTPSPQSPPAALSPGDQVHHTADRDAKDGELVEVFGTYTAVAGGKAEDAAPSGHAAITLADGSTINLAPPWRDDAIRPEREQKFIGKEVVAKGLLMVRCPPPPDGRAYRTGPCLAEGVSVMARSTYDFVKSGGE